METDAKQTHHKEGIKKKHPGIWSYLYTEKRSHMDMQLQEAANPQLHRNLEACLPLKLTTAEWLSQPVQRQECATGKESGLKNLKSIVAQLQVSPGSPKMPLGWVLVNLSMRCKAKIR